MQNMESQDVVYCHSCGRNSGSRFGEVEPVEFLGIEWCPRCVKVGRISSGTVFVDQPSPGRMYPNPLNDPLDAFFDCFKFKPKHRILKDDAKREIQRAWTLWQGDKANTEAMFVFYSWLVKNRPYFLTFHYKYDRWQIIHCWLQEHECDEHALHGQETQ